MKTKDIVENVRQREAQCFDTVLQVGDVFEQNGTQYVIWMVNASRASALPMSGRTRSFKDSRSDKDVSFDVESRAMNISPNASVKVLERLGKSGLISYLENRNHERNMSKEATNKKEKKDKAPSLGRLGGFLGHPITAVVRAMAKAGWEYWECRNVFDAKKIPVSDNTIRIQLSAGRADDSTAAPLTKSQLADLRPDASEKPARKEAAPKKGKKAAAKSEKSEKSEKPAKSKKPAADEDEDDEAPKKSSKKPAKDDEDDDFPDRTEDGE